MSSQYNLSTTLANLSESLAREHQQIIESHLKEALKIQTEKIIETVARQLAKQLKARLTAMHNPMNGQIEVTLMIDNVEISKEHV